MKKIQRILRQWKREVGAQKVMQFRYRESEGTLCLYTCEPGIFIGFKGNRYDKYKKILQDEFPEMRNICFVETEWLWV